MKLEKFIDNLKKARNYGILSAERKQVLKSEILNKIEARPQKIEYPATPAYANIFSIMRMPVFASLMLLIFVGAGVSMAAGKSLPGDFLYPIKVNVNEEVAGLLAFTPQAKADWELSRAKTRLQEASKLALTKPQVSDSVKKDLEQNFEEHVMGVQNNVAKMTAAGNIRKASETVSKLETTLLANQDVLQDIGSTQNTTSVLPLEDVLSRKISELDATQTSLEDKIASGDNGSKNQVSTQNKIDQAQASLDSAKSLLEAKKSLLHRDSVDNAQGNIDSAGELLSEAQGSLGAGQSGDAFNLARESLSASAQAKSFIQAKLDLISSELNDSPETQSTSDSNN